MADIAASAAVESGEGIDGVRMTWNAWPRSKVEASKCVIPIAASINLIRSHPDIQILPYNPLRCKSCTSILNPYCHIDFTAKIWICPFCFNRNHFPQHYHAISEFNLPGELCYTTIEYAIAQNLPAQNNPVAIIPPPVFLFILDTCIIEEELGYARSALKQAIGLLPENALVGFISFGTQVQVHELGFSDLSKVYVFRGTKEITKEQILDQLGLSPSAQRGAAGYTPKGVTNGFNTTPAIHRFLLPASECEFTIDSVLEELQSDQWPVPPGNRAKRCTGVALSVASGLLAACMPGTGARIVALVGGPCTEGPGKIVSEDLSEPVRSHKDLQKDAAPHFGKAVKFYENLAKQLVSQGHVLDLFASALDQVIDAADFRAIKRTKRSSLIGHQPILETPVGVAEMKVVVERTGGLVVLAESFGHSVFKDSFRRVYEDSEQSLGLSFNGNLEVNVSKDIKIQGIIGPCTSLEKKGPSCADTVIGQGNTTAWKMCGLDRTTCLTVFFDVSPSERSNAPGTSQPHLYLQFLTNYQNPDGQMRFRVTTVTRRWVDSAANSEELVEGFDQETAAVVMARMTSLKMEMEEEFDATRWIDRSLIRLCSRFGDYRKDDPSSFTLNPCFSIFPQFMFNLRRSQFLQVFNNSPDETAYFRMLLNRENITSSVVMIQPSLMSYILDSPPTPVLLDVASISADRILFLDAYFSVVIFHGMTIAQWRNSGYHKNPDFQNFAQLLEAPQDDAKMIIRERFPVPRLVVCDQHGSQARFLLARLNPSATYNNSNEVTGTDVIFTDDVSLQIFFEHLQRLAVQS